MTKQPQPPLEFHHFWVGAYNDGHEKGYQKGYLAGLRAALDAYYDYVPTNPDRDSPDEAIRQLIAAAEAEKDGR